MISLHIESKVPMAWAQHCADYKKGFHEKRFIQHHLLTVISYEGIAGTFHALFSTAEPSKDSKRVYNKLNATWNMTQCKAVSFFFFSLCLLPKYTSRYKSLECVVHFQ